MKYNNLRAFEKHLQDSSPEHFVDVYLIISKEQFQCKQAADLLINYLSKAQSEKAFNVQRYEAAEIPVEKLITELNSFSFFSQKPIIMLQNLEKAPKVLLEKLEPSLAAAKLPVTLILLTSSLAASTKLFKRIEKIGVLLDIPEEKSWNKEKTAQEWLLSLSKQNGKSFAPQACMALIKRVGTDSSTLFQEHEKLLCYVGDRKEITVQDVQAICTAANIDTIWQLGEAIFRRDPANALRISKGLLEDELPFVSLLRQLRSQFETEYKICSILSQGGTAKEIGEQFPKMGAFIIERHMQQAQAYGSIPLRNGLLKIDEAELNFKNSLGDAEVLNELLMAHLTL